MINGIKKIVDEDREKLVPNSKFQVPGSRFQVPNSGLLYIKGIS
jgi:hypothetical protein